jgi:hypothetical protein
MIDVTGYIKLYVLTLRAPTYYLFFVYSNACLQIKHTSLHFYYNVTVC